DDLTRGSLFSNVGTTVAFQLSQHDAEVMANELDGGRLPADWLALPKYHAYVRILTDAVPSAPFSVRTQAAAKRRGDEQSPDTPRRTSHHRYTKPARQVDRHLAAALA